MPFISRNARHSKPYHDLSVFQRSTESNESQTSTISHLKQTWEKISNWTIFLPYVPRLSFWSSCSTTDHIIGLTLHCFILSLMVLGVALAKLTWIGFKLACFIFLNYAVFRGDIMPIQEDNSEPITHEQIQDATIFDSCGLKIIVLQKRTKRMNTPVLSDLTPSRPYDSGSDSSQDTFSISTNKTI
nr:hypothetical protein BgiMline_026257 [Biomphalaria glabrata]